MATLRDRPYLNGNFLVDLGTGDSNSLVAGFAEVIMPTGAIEIIEYRTGNEKSRDMRKTPRIHYETVILRRGLIGALDLYQWWDETRNGNDTRRNITVQLLNENRTETVFSYKLRNAVPVRYNLSPLNALGNEVVMEELELTYEGFVVE